MIRLQELNYEGIVEIIKNSDKLDFTSSKWISLYSPKKNFDKYRCIVVPVNFDLEPRVEVHQKAENGEPIRNVRIWKDNLGVCLANEEVDKWGFSRNLREKYVQIVRELGVPSSVRNPSSYSHSCFTLNYYFAPDQNNIELTQILFSGMGRRILTPELKKLNKIALKNGS